MNASAGRSTRARKQRSTILRSEPRGSRKGSITIDQAIAARVDAERKS
jgi:hypothetical protein